MPQLVNTAGASGEYESMPVADSTRLVVELSALSIVKSADKQIWLDEELTYTIVVTNVDARSPTDPLNPGSPVESVVVTDSIDVEIAQLIEASLTVTLNDPPVPVTPVDYDYDPDTGELIIRLDPLLAGEFATISFQVERP